MKLHSNKDKKKIAILIGCCVLIVVVGILVFVSLDNKPRNNGEAKETGISLSSPPLKTEYYLNEEFDPAGTQIQVETNVNNNTYFVDYTKLSFEGFDSSVVNDALVITVSYMEFSTTFTVKIKEHPNPNPTLESISISENFNTTYPKTFWNKYGPTFDNVMLVCTYSDGTTKEVPLTRKYCSGVNDVNSSGVTQFTVRYSEGGINLEIIVDITITE